MLNRQRFKSQDIISAVYKALATSKEPVGPLAHKGHRGSPIEGWQVGGPFSVGADWLSG